MKVELLYIDHNTTSLFFLKRNVKSKKEAELIASWVRGEMNKACVESSFSAQGILDIIKETNKAYIGFYVAMVEDKPNPYNKLPMQRPAIFTIKTTAENFKRYKENSNDLDVEYLDEILEKLRA